jgi:hypothetical protein
MDMLETNILLQAEYISQTCFLAGTVINCKHGTDQTAGTQS